MLACNEHSLGLKLAMVDRPTARDAMWKVTCVGLYIIVCSVLIKFLSYMASFPIFRFPFFLLHFGFPFFRFPSFRFRFSLSLLSGSRGKQGSGMAAGVRTAGCIHVYSYHANSYLSQLVPSTKSYPCHVVPNYQLVPR